MAAVVVLSGSVSVAAAVLVPGVPLVPAVPLVPVVLLVPAVPLVAVVPVPVLHEPELPALAPPVLQLRPEPLLLDLLLLLLLLLLPQVVVESEEPVHLQGRQSFSPAMARNSPPTGKPTYERAPSTR